MGFGQVEQFFDAGPEADAEKFATPEGNQRMRKLVAAPESIRPRVHEAENSVAPIGRNNDQHGKGNQQQDDEDGEQARTHATEEKDAHGHRDDHHESAEIRFLEQQDADRHHRRCQRQESFFQVVHVRHLAHRIVGGIKHDEQLHQFRRLQIGKAERQPAARAIDVAPDPRNQHQRQQDDATDKQPGRELLPVRHRHLEGCRGRHQTNGQKDAMTYQEIRRIVAGKTPALGNGDGSGIDHHHAQHEQKQTAPQQGQVDLGRHPAGGVEGRDHPASLSSACTMLMNASARCT